MGRTASIESSDIVLDFSEKKIPVEFEFQRQQEFIIKLVNDNGHPKGVGRFLLSDLVTKMGEGITIDLKRPKEGLLGTCRVHWSMLGAGN